MRIHKTLQNLLRGFLILPITLGATEVTIQAPFEANFMFISSPAKNFLPLRNYSKLTTAKEKEDLRYIITTLAYRSWAEILRSQSSIEKAGDRIDHLHPLNFLYEIFSNEKTKAGFLAIYQQPIVWKKFKKGLFDSLDTESKRNNLSEAYVVDFAGNLGIDAAQIKPLVFKRDWTGFVERLVQLSPRQGKPGRYDM